MLTLQQTKTDSVQASIAPSHERIACNLRSTLLKVAMTDTREHSRPTNDIIWKQCVVVVHSDFYDAAG